MKPRRRQGKRHRSVEGAARLEDKNSSRAALRYLTKFADFLPFKMPAATWYRLAAALCDFP